ncbi:phage scaffolding protein [Paenibacillus antarcticus]|uniref:Scaffolding protein n=1 Tax=Paenibacillus antarcticus TaxID=253703 RepID=A0A168PA27_9BACL|nr:phage scaffolding protein [Paenibacillus antarcticus]OAB46551.1 hypothetical protein PBAT_11075 [Paenibacillus antarcticus]
MDLKELLGEELYNQIVAKAGDKKLAVVNDGNWFPKEKFDEVNIAKKQAESDLKDRDNQLSDLKKSTGDNKVLQDQITQLQTDNKTASDKYEAEVKTLRINTALKLALATDTHDPDLVAGLLDKTKIELDESGNVKSGLDDQIKSLRESKAFLFVEKQDGEPRFKGAKPPEGGGNKGGGQPNPWKKDTLNYTEQGKILRENPDLAKQLQAAAK